MFVNVMFSGREVEYHELCSTRETIYFHQDNIHKSVSFFFFLIVWRKLKFAHSDMKRSPEVQFYHIILKPTCSHPVLVQAMIECISDRYPKHLDSALLVGLYGIHFINYFFLFFFSEWNVSPANVHHLITISIILVTSAYSMLSSEQLRSRSAMILTYRLSVIRIECW